MFCPKGCRKAGEELICSCVFWTVMDNDSNGLEQNMLFGL